MERISRRKLLTAGGGAALVGAMVAPGIAQAQARKDIASPWAMVVDVAIDPRSRDGVRQPTAGASAPSGPVFESGTIYRQGGLNTDDMKLGTYRGWGWMYNPSRDEIIGVASFDFDGVGEIVAAGVPAGRDARAPVTGGTGDYRGVNGQAEFGKLGDMAFRVIFDLVNFPQRPT